MIVPRYLSLLLSLAACPLAADDFAFFEERIRPVLVTHCYECHSAAAAERGKLKAGLLVDSRDGILRGGESGPALVPGKEKDSLLLKALRHEELEMPPDKKLPATVIADFATWIESGAPDPRTGETITDATIKVKRGMTITEGRNFWAFVPPQAPAAPTVQRTTWAANDIDRFVLARLEQAQLSPLPDADPSVLVRRLYFDLIGLPPTSEEIEDVVSRGVWPSRDELTREVGTCDAEAAPSAAYAALVERLLASPQFGERWGRHWLDVARYADSNGRDRNVYYHHAWRYRDFVIDAINADQPFDRLIQAQIAGDLLPAASTEERDANRIATGFLALGAKAFEEQKPDIFRMDVVDEQIELIGRAILGLSLGCARCHDHKFDAIPTADYYALAGILRSTELLYGYGPKGIKTNVHAHSELAAVGPDAERLAASGLAYFARLQELTLVQNTARSDRYRVVRQLSAKKLDLAKPDADKAALQPEIEELEARIKAWDVTVKQAEDALQAAMDTPPPQPGWAMAVRESPQPANCRVHVRGETTNLADEIPRGMLQVVSLPAEYSIPAASSGRLQLARWLTHPRHPLTSRVLVNRVWQHLFGRGLVATPDDFGANGARPTHPALLDHLAVRFVDEGWSLKRLVRTIVLSRSYRMASDPAAAVAQRGARGPELFDQFHDQLLRDPDTRYLWRMRPRRLEAEAMRDAIRAVAGTLNRRRPSAEESLFARHNPYREDEYRAFKPLFSPADIESPYRSVYLPVVRGVLPDLFQLFDFAPPERTISQREESVVPAQALYFLNNPWLIEQASHLARRSLDDTPPNDAARLRRVFQLALGRDPSPAEVARGMEFVRGTSTQDVDLHSDAVSARGQAPEDRWISLCQALFATMEFRYVR